MQPQPQQRTDSDITKDLKRITQNINDLSLQITTARHQAPKQRLKLIKEAILVSTSLTEFKKHLEEAQYNTAQQKRYTALYNFNQEQNTAITDLTEYDSIIAQSDTKTVKEVKQDNPTMTARQAEKTAKEHNKQAKAKTVKSTEIKKDTFHKPTYQELESKVARLEAELKTATRLKKQYHKQNKGIDLTPLNEAQKRLDSFLESLQASFRAYAELSQRRHEEKSAFVIDNLRGGNPFKILGLSKTATLEEVKSKYRQLVKLCHPDKTEGNEEQFRTITDAYKRIKNAND